MSAPRAVGRPVAAVLALVALLALAAPAGAHVGGKAQPRIAGGVSAGAGLTKTVTVTVEDADGGGPISGASVTLVAEMAADAMRTRPVALAEVRPGVYRARVRFQMAGRWTGTVAVTGAELVAAEATLPVTVTAPAPQDDPAPAAPAPGEDPPAAAPAPVAELTTQLDDDLTDRDATSMAVLWLHGLAAMGWTAGVLLLVIALSARPGVVAEPVRMRLARAYRRWGAWVHWGCVPVVVATGLFQMWRVTPFPLAWTAEGLERVADVPYGALYEAVLVVKLGLFAAMLVTGTQLLRRSLAEPVHVADAAEPAGPVAALRAALGPAGLTYLAMVPLILAAAMALRYVHVLSHAGHAVVGG